MADQQLIGTDLPQDGAERIVAKLESIDRKLKLILWFIALPFVFMAAMFVLNFVVALAFTVQPR